MLRLFTVLLVPLLLAGCTGTGAVSPLSPKKAQETPGISASGPAGTLYWTPDAGAPTLNARTLTGLDLLSNDEGYACGNEGVILRWDGAAWRPVKTGLPLTEDLYALDFYDAREGFVVGRGGLILSFRNGAWERQESPVSENLLAVAIPKSGMAWAAGENGVLLSYEGGVWRKVETGVSEHLRALGFSDPAHGWAAGDRGVLLRYEGAAWRLYEPAPTAERLNALSVNSDASAWAAGSFGTLLRFNGTTWTRAENPRSGLDLYGVWVEDDAWGWAVGQEGTLLHYDGFRWIPHRTVEGKPSLNAVAFAGRNTGFAAGQDGVLLRFRPGGEPVPGPLRIAAEAQGGEGFAFRLSYRLSNAGDRAFPDAIFRLKVPGDWQPFPVSEPTPPPVGEGARPTLEPPSEASLGPAAPEVDRERPRAASLPWKEEKGLLVWALGTLAARSERTLRLELRPKREGKLRSSEVRAWVDSGKNRLADAPALRLPPPTPTPTPGKKSAPGERGGVR